MQSMGRRGLAVLAIVTMLPAARGHLHLELVYREDRLQLVWLDFETGELDPASVVIAVGPLAARPIPAAPAWTNLLGEAGRTTWVLPQTEHPQVPWLGVGSGGLPTSEWDGDLSLHLWAVDGPGTFVWFLMDAFGYPRAVFNSRDGLTREDVLPVPPRAHVHGNWAFSAPGRYRLTFGATGTRRGHSTRVSSSPTMFSFDVVPPPPPKLALARVSAQTAHLILEAFPGLNYHLEASATFGHWTVLTNLHAAGPQTTHPIILGPTPFQFLRARLR